MSWKFFFRRSLLRVFHAGGAGFFVAVILSALSLAPYEIGRQSTGLLEKFFEHAVPNLAVFTPGFFVGGVALMFYESMLGRFLRRRVCMPIVELLWHSVAVAAGAVAGLLFAASFVADIRPQAGILVGTMILLVVLCLQFDGVLLALRGRFDKYLGDGKVAEFVWTMVGIAVAAGSSVQFYKDVQAAEAGLKGGKVCAEKAPA